MESTSSFQTTAVSSVKSTVHSSSQNLIKFLCSMLNTLQKTIPVFLAANSIPMHDITGDFSITQQPPSHISMGELLYPAFNRLVPLMTENLLPRLPTITEKEAASVIGLYYGVVNFAFRT